jgi:hypothetical protein
MFGNPLSSSINGLKATIDWGRVNAKGVADNTSARSKEIIFSETLYGGRWTPVSVVLDGGVPATELGFVRLKNIQNTGISLIGRP